MSENNGDLETLIQEKIESDTDFQDSLADLSEEEQESLIKDKKSEILLEEARSLREKAEKATKSEELANNYKIRAEKAEKLLKNKSVGEGNPNNNPSAKKGEDKLSDKDLIAIINNKVHDDDIEEIKDIAKIKGITVAEALKLDLTKTILSEKAEQRKSAEVSNTSASRRGTQKVSDDTLKEKLSKGEIPEAGSSEAEQLFWARRGGKR